MITKIFNFLNNFILNKLKSNRVFKYSTNIFGLIIFISIMTFWGINKINRKKLEILENKVLNNITNTTYLNQYIYNKWHRCDYSSFSNIEKCMKIKVPLNWKDKNSKKIGIYVKRYGNPKPKRIVVLLSGGPGGVGSSYTDLAKDLYHKDKDQLFLIPDHRGSGFSENLWCERDKRVLSIQDIDNKKFESCFKDLKDKWKNDLQFFNSWQAGMDIHAILEMYPNLPVSIYASSYGTIWAQRVLSKKNINIQKVYLESPILLRHGNFYDRNVEDPIKVFYESCKESPYCSEKMNLNSFDDLKNLFKNVHNHEHCRHNLSSEAREIISKKSIWLLQYNYTAPLFAFLISSIKSCDEHQIKNIFKYKNEINITEIGNYKYSSYLHYNIFCNEITNRKLTKNDKYLYSKNSSNHFGFVDNSVEKCSAVPEYEVEKNNFSFLKDSSYKTLIVHGEADTSTTREYALALKTKFIEENTKFISIKKLAHIPLAFRINYDEFFEDKYHEAEKCRFHILSEFFKDTKDWPDLTCTENIYPPIYSSDNALKLYEKIFNNI
jgi:alpha-beta hydrolase superfamily lysophospholipase